MPRTQCSGQAAVELVVADAGQSQRGMATPAVIITEVTGGHHWIEACSAAEHEWQWTQSKELLWRLGYLCLVATWPMPKLCSHGNQNCTCQARELAGADAGQSQRSMATPVAITTEVTDGYLQGRSLLSGRT